MKRVLLPVILLILTFSLGEAQDACNPPAVKKGKLRVFGDSWAAFPFTYHSYDSAFVQYGFPEYKALGDRTAIISMNSEAFLNPLARIFWEPEIERDVRNGMDAMVFSLGGNDLAFKPNVGDSLTVLNEPFHQAKRNMDTLLDYLHGKLPDMEILWTCYDYPNFVDPIIAFPWNPYFDLWDGAGQPAPWQINAVVKQIAFLQDSLTQVWGRPYIHFYNNLGLMQFTYGQSVPQQVWPFGTYPPRSVPFPGGNTDYTTPWQAQGLEGLDTYHLNGAGYTHLAAHQFRVFLSNLFRKERDTMIYSMGQTYDGWVSETGTTGTGEVQVGKNAGNVKLKGIFSFDTEFIPDDKKIKRASLFIRRKDGSYYTYPREEYPTNFKLDMKNGTFGTDQLEAADYSEAGTSSDVGCFAGQPILPNYSLRIDLIPSALTQINKTGITQFRLEITADTAQGASIINFFNGDTTEFEGPYLDIYYDTATVTGIRQNVSGELKLFPNPAKNKLYIQADQKMTQGEYNLAIYDEKGALIISRSVFVRGDEMPVDVSNLQSGSYIIQLSGKDKLYGGSFIKMN